MQYNKYKLLLNILLKNELLKRSAQKRRKSFSQIGQLNGKNSGKWKTGEQMHFRRPAKGGIKNRQFPP
jgi:hypothetical protein